MRMSPPYRCIRTTGRYISNPCRLPSVEVWVSLLKISAPLTKAVWINAVPGS